MRSFSISVYSIQMSDPLRTENYTLGRLPSGQDFFDLLNQFLDELKSTLSNDKLNQEMLKVSLLEQKGRTLSGQFERGDYGYASKLVNVESQKTSYKRKIGDAELLPYYFLAAIPKNQKTGLLAIQRSGVSGVKSPVEHALHEFLSIHYPDCKLVIERIIPAKVIEQYLERGRIAKIRLVRLSIPNDIADFMHDGHQEHSGTIEYQITPKSGFVPTIAKRVLEIIKRTKNIDDLMVVKGFEYDNAKIEIEFNGKHRTINLAEPDNLRADYDITKNIILDQGLPTYASVDEISREIVRDILESLRLEIQDV